MALGYTTYKTPNPITLITADLSDYEGHGVYLSDAGVISLATAKTDIPYGVIVVGANSEDGTGSGTVAASALEIVDALGCVVQCIAGTGGVTAGDYVSIGAASHFVAASTTIGDYNWGLALQTAPAGEQFLMRFQPFKVYSSTP
jgi:hypothetical protein